MFENLSISRLRVFCEVAQTKSFRVAAENLDLSQPSVSQNINMLEKETRLLLFERGRVNTLTDDGKFLYDYAKRIVELTEEAAHNVEELSNGNIGKICFGANNPLVGGMITPLSQGFLADNPKVELVLLTGMPKKVCEMVLNHELSFGIIIGSASHPELESKPISRDEIVVVVGSSHPLASRKTISTRELSEQPFVYTRDPPSYLHGILDVFSKNGILINERFMEIDSMDSIRQTLKKGIGLSAMLRQFAEEDLLDGSLHKISLEGGPLYVDISRIVRKNKFLSPLCRRFIQYIDDTAKTLPA